MVFKTTETPCRAAYWWLTREESNDSELLNSIKKQVRQYQRSGYVTATFHSGIENVETSMYRIMKHNFELQAQSDSQTLTTGGLVVFTETHICIEHNNVNVGIFYHRINGQQLYFYLEICSNIRYNVIMLSKRRD